MEKKSEPRGIPLSQQKLWAYTIEKENELRLKWFKKNEFRLDELTNESHQRQVPEEIKQEMEERTLNNLRRCEKQKPKKEIQPVFIEKAALYNIMRPVDKEVTKLLYESVVNDGRERYLKERYKLIPEKRYYFPECTSFRYGWNTWDLFKSLKGSPFARQQVIKESFYRRRGVNRDPEWYKEPARLSPQVCGRI